MIPVECFTSGRLTLPIFVTEQLKPLSCINDVLSVLTATSLDICSASYWAQIGLLRWVCVAHRGVASTILG